MMKRFLLQRLPGTALFLAACLVVWTIPWMRHLATMQLTGPTSWVMYPGIGDIPNVSYLDPGTAKRLPNDLNVLATVADQQGESKTLDFDSGPRNPKLEYLGKIAAYDHLIRRFPNQPWLIAARLRWSVESQDYSPDSSKQVLALARQGSRLEPNNCFYDWVDVLFLVDAGRKVEALQTMHDAAAKPIFDDHAYDSLTALIAAHKEVQPLSMEEKFAIASTAPHLSMELLQGAAAKICIWALSSDPTVRLRITNDLAHFAAPMELGRNRWETAWSGAIIQSDAWTVAREHYLASGSPGTPRLGVASLTQSLNLASQFALAQRRPDIAMETKRLGTHALIATINAGEIDAYDFARTPNYSTALTLWWLSLACLLQIGLLVVFSTIFSVLLIATRPPQLARNDQFLSVGGVVCVMIVVAWCCFRVHLADTIFSDYDGDGPANPLQAALGALSLAAFFLAPPIIGALVCGGATLARLWRSRAELKAKADNEYDPATRDLLPRDMRQTILAVAGFCYGFALFGCLAASVIAFATQAPSWTLPALPVGSGPTSIYDPATFFGLCAFWLSLFCYLGWIVVWRWLTPKHKRPYTHYALRWYRQTLSLSILLSAFAYIALSLASLPCRHAADREFDQLCRRGQLATMGFPNPN